MSSPQIADHSFGQAERHPGPTLVVGFDGSDGAAAAVRWAAARTMDGGRLLVVHGHHPAVPEPASTFTRTRARLEALWMAEDIVVDAEPEIVSAEGLPAPALCRVAAEVAADGIVVGRHHAGPFSADTVRHLLQIADRPVTVVPS